MKFTRITMLIFAVMAFLLGASYAQKQGTNQRREYLIDPSSPSVYILVDKNAKSTIIGEDQMMLQLVNNLRWGIRLSLSPPRKGAGDARLEYDLLSSDDSILAREQCHVCTLAIVNPGERIRFIVPANKLEEAQMLRIKYSFVWEKALDAEERVEPTHYVYFESKQNSPK